MVPPGPAAQTRSMAQIPGYLRPAPESRPSSFLGILGALGPDRDRRERPAAARPSGPAPGAARPAAGSPATGGVGASGRG